MYRRERDRIGTIIHIQVRVNRNGACIETASLRTLAAHKPCTKDTANLVYFGGNVCTGSVSCTTRGKPGLKKIKVLNCMPELLRCYTCLKFGQHQANYKAKP